MGQGFDVSYERFGRILRERATTCAANSFVQFIDGVHDLREMDTSHYRASFETKVAYMKFKSAVTVEITRVREPCEIECRIEGKSLVVVGRLTATSVTRSEDAGPEPRVYYAIVATLAGKLGSIGQPVLRAETKAMEQQFAERLRSKFAAATLEQ